MSGLCFMVSDNGFDIFKRLSLYDIAIKNTSTTYNIKKKKTGFSSFTSSLKIATSEMV